MKKRIQILAILGAVLLHAGILLFGGLLLLPQNRAHRTTVEDISLEAEKKIEEKQEQKDKALDVERQQAPEAPPELKEDAAPLDLAQLEMALGGASGGGDFMTRLPASFGGQGGLAMNAVSDVGLDGAFSLSDLDQAPRATYQPPPEYPATLRRQKLDGSVSVVFIVGTDGRVVNPVVQSSTHPAFEPPALQAVRRWRFEPGQRNGKAVAFKMRVPIAFRSR